MAFGLTYRHPHLFRQRADLKWVEPMLIKRAKALGWDGREPLRYYDSDGYSLGGVMSHGQPQ